jgi:hypothetical protein
MTQQNTEPEPSTAASADQADASAPAPLVAVQSPSLKETPAIISAITKSKKFAVFDDIVKLDDIRKIVDIVEDITQQSSVSFTRRFLVEELDNKYESSSVEIFKKDGFLDNKYITSIAIYYTNTSIDSKESISMIVDRRDITTGELSISGKNDIWIDGVMSRFSQLIRLWEMKSTDKARAIQATHEKDSLTIITQNAPEAEDRVSETRKFSISNVIVTLDNLREISKIIEESANKIKVSDYRFRRIHIETQDGSEYKSSSSNILSQGSILDSKQINKIRMYFEDSMSEDRPSISIYLTHGNSYGSNYIEVIGNESTWVNGVMRRFEDIVGDWERQPTWPRRFQWAFVLLFVIGIMRVIWLIVLTILSQYAAAFPQINSLSPSRKLITSLVITILPALLFAIPGYYITDKLVELWPNVELRTGREHAQIYRKRRDRLWTIMGLIIIPLLITFLYDLIKLLFQ